MTIGEIVKLKKGFYVVVNVQGTLEKLPQITLLAQLYLEIRQGFGKYFTVLEAREFMNKHKRTKL